MSQSPFQKFVNQKKNSAVKEGHRQERKKIKKERAAFFDQKRQEKFAEKRALMEKSNGSKTKPGFDKKPNSKVAESKTADVKPIKKIAIEEVMPLNKYLAHCGICSRRDAVALIQEGKVKLNGKIATEPGYKVQPRMKFFTTIKNSSSPKTCNTSCSTNPRIISQQQTTPRAERPFYNSSRVPLISGCIR